MKYIIQKGDRQGNQLKEYQNMMLGADYELIFKCTVEGSYFRQVMSFQLECHRNNNYQIYLIEPGKQRRKIVFDLEKATKNNFTVSELYEFEHFFRRNTKPRITSQDDICHMTIVASSGIMGALWLVVWLLN